MRRFILSAVLVLAGQAQAAEPFYVEDPALGDLPLPVETIVTATLASNPGMRACSLTGRKVQMPVDSQVEGFVVTTRHACGWGAAAAPLWLVRGSAAGYKVASISSGYTVEVTSKSHRGMHSVVVRAGTAAGESTVKWKFDGREY